MEFVEYCRMTKDSKNKLFYNFNDRKAVDSEKIQAVSVGAFLTIQHAEVLAVETLNGIDYVTLDLNFDGLVKFIRRKQK